jgi:probable F420-dependent oxidoreductase
MVDIGICSMQTHYTVQPAELARWAEDTGFESVFFGEHSHVPTNRETKFVLEVEMPDYYREISDPFICMTAAAAVTERIKVGTSVCLVPEHNPIMLAKVTSCVDLVSSGRLVLGIGAGWSAEELRDHGVEHKDRWRITRERMLAVREIWGNEIAEFHGDFVDFDPLYCWPKPVQPGGPPVLIGAAAGPMIARHIVEYCDGWLPLDGLHTDLVGGLANLRAESSRKGRPMSDLDLTVITAYTLAGVEGSVARIAELVSMGFNRVLLLLAPGEPKQQWEELEHHRKLLYAAQNAGL